MMNETCEKLKGIIELEVLDLINRRLECEIKETEMWGGRKIEVTITGNALGRPFTVILAPAYDHIREGKDKFMYLLAQEVGMKLVGFIYEQRSKRYGV